MNFGHRFENWTVVYNPSMGTVAVQNEETKAAVFFQGDEGAEQVERFDELGISAYLDEFCNNELDTVMNEWDYADYSEDNDFNKSITWINED